MMGRKRERTGLSVRVLMVLLAAIPIVGGIIIGVRRIDVALDDAERASALEAGVTALVETSRLRTALVDERNWTSGALVIRDLGVDPSAAALFTGIDIGAELDAARIAVDEAIASSPERAELEPRVDSIRESADAYTPSNVDELVPVARLYDDLELELDARVGGQFNELLSMVGSLDQGGDLIATLRVFEAASSIREQVVGFMATTIAASFAFETVPGEAPVLQRLTEANVRLIDAFDVIAGAAAPDSGALAEFERFRSAPVVARQLERVEQLVATGGPPPASPDFAELLDRLDELLPLFEDSVASIGESFALVEIAGADATAEARSIAADARGWAQRLAITVVVVGLLVVLASTLLVRAIVRPLRTLSEGAQRIRDGEIDQHIDTDGPREIRDAALALNDATAGLRHFREQIDGIARGDVIGPPGASGRTGALDDSIRAAVDTLATSMSARDELQEQLTYEATHDGLTKLANRRASLDVLRSTVEQQATSLGAVLFVDLDGFKQVNDHFGHRTGDVALRTVALRLSTALGRPAHIGRLGGDEFIVILSDIESVAEATTTAHALIDAVSRPIMIEETTVELSACVGVALTDHQASAQELLHEADVAVYEAKRQGSGVVVVCDAMLREEMHRTSQLDAELRDAVVSGQFEVWLQPVVDADTLEESSREALIRWHHPERGLVPPGEFIPFAERSDLIIEIDRWVLRRVTELLAEEPDATPIAVNVSGRHLSSELFLDDVIQPLAVAGVDASRVVIEVTESAVLDDVGRAAAHLEQLREIGVSVAIDDFGTGYASLSYLRQLPVDVIKIDRSFTRDEGSRSLVSMVVETARLLGMRVTAEGVEDADQVEVLRSLGVDRLQGYHLGIPSPPIIDQVGDDSSEPEAEPETAGV